MYWSLEMLKRIKFRKVLLGDVRSSGDAEGVKVFRDNDVRVLKDDDDDVKVLEDNDVSVM